MSKDTVLNQILDTGVVAIMRASSSDQLLSAAEAILDGGVSAIEVTMTTPNAMEVIRQATAKFGNQVLFGVGTVLDSETARAAILAGAQFVVCPTLNLGTIQICNRYSIPVMPGAYTPTEILTAWEAGADVVKVFPASVGGPSYFRAIKGPLPHIKLSPTGGVHLDTAAEFIRAGAEFLGVGGELVTKSDLAAGNLEGLRDRAAQYIRVIQEARKG